MKELLVCSRARPECIICTHGTPHNKVRSCRSEGDIRKFGFCGDHVCWSICPKCCLRVVEEVRL